MTQLKEKNDKLKNVLGFLAVATVLGVIGMVCPMVYGFNDDAMIADILSGAYLGEPDGHAVYMKYPLTGLLSLLYRISDAVAWFPLFFAFVLAVCIYFILKTVAQNVRKTGFRVGAVILTLIVLVMLLFPHYVVLHYTIMAAVFGGTAVFVLLTDNGDTGWRVKNKYFSSILLFLCYMVRSQVFFLTLPFLLVALLWKLADTDKTADGGRKEELKSSGIYVAVLLAGTAILIIINQVMYGSHEWKRYMEYNDARTEIYDYVGMLPYDEYQQIYDDLEISREVYDVLYEYGTVADAEIDANLLYELAEVTEEINQSQISLKTLFVNRAKEYYYRTLHRTDAPYNYVVLALYAIVFIYCLLHKHWMRLLLLFCLGGGRSLIWLYLMMKGRYPERVTISLYLIEGLLLAGMFIGYIRTRSREVNGKAYFGIAVLGIGILVCLPGAIKQVRSGYDKALYQQSIQESWEELRSYMSKDPESFFYLDVYSVVAPTGMQYRTVEYENYMLLGGWMSRSVLLQEKQMSTGYASVTEALVKGEKIYLVLDEKRGYEWIKNYMGIKGYNVSFVPVDKVGKYLIYQTE